MTEPKHDGLPVGGYKPQSPMAVELVNANKQAEEEILRTLDWLAQQPNETVDKGWLATGRTQIEQGFMAVNRSIFKPGRVQLPEDDAANAESRRIMGFVG